MLSDVIKKYGGEKMDPLDVYKDILLFYDEFQHTTSYSQV